MEAFLRQHLGVASLTLMILVIGGLGVLYMTTPAELGHSGSRSYELLADNLLDSGIYSLEGETPSAYRMPAYVLLVALAKVLGGERWFELLMLLQGTLILLTGFLWYRTCQRISDSWWIPPLLCLTFTAHLSLHAELFAMRETVVFAFLTAWFFHLASAAEWTPRARLTMIALCVLAFYTRPTGVLLFVPLAALVMLRTEWPAARRTVFLGLALATVVLAAVPWQAYQSRIAGKLVLSPTPVVGLSRFTANSSLFERVAPYIDADAGYLHVERIAQAGLDEPPGPAREQKADDRLRELATREIRSDPAQFVRRIFIRAMAFLSPFKTPLGHSELRIKDGQLRLDDYRGNLLDAGRYWPSLARHGSLFVISLFAIPLGLLAMAIHACSSPRLRALAWASLLFVAANVGIYALTSAETRYRLPLDPLLAVWAWMAVGMLLRPLKPAE